MKEKDEEIETLKLRNGDFQEKQTNIINTKSQKIFEQNDVIKAKNEEIAKLRFDLACTKCDYKAETMNSLITHVIRKHDTREDLTIICDDCDYKCLKDFDLQLHKSAKHPGNLIAYKGFTKMKLLEAGMTSLEQRRERGDLIHMYRIMTGKDDVQPSTWFQLMADRDGGANTRAAAGHLNVLNPDNSNSDIRRNFFSQRVVQSWNSLPDVVKMSQTVNQFKNSLDDFKAWGGHLPRAGLHQQ